MSVMKRPVCKPFKVKRCIKILESIRKTVASEKETVKAMYDIIVEMMRHENPEFVAGSLDEEDITDAHSNREDPLQRVDQELRVSMEELNENLEANAALKPLQNEAVLHPVSNSYTVPNGTSLDGPSTLSLKKPPNRKQVSNSGLPSPFDPSVVIKVEESGSDDSNSEETKKTEHLVHRMMAPCSAPSNPMSPKSLLHYVVIENLPIRVTADEVVNELFGLLGISREDVTGITVLNDKTESFAQIYLKDLKHVQKILVFSGKLVFKGRVIASKIGMS